ncbi:hypothetical protein DV514_11500 [Legionella pneumophila]|nr:hypothetical protein DV939_14205 [Legionella pneumophila]RDE54416.1 hypothetical protein DV514_11500 [Legionella pneumophila]
MTRKFYFWQQLFCGRITSAPAKKPNFFVKNCFQFVHLAYLNSLIKNIFCLDLGAFRKP